MVVSTLVPKTSSPQPLSAAFEFAAAVMRLKQLCSNTFKCLDLSPCCSTTFLPNVITESLNTSVRVCLAQPSHSGAECDPRHRGAVFAWESNHPNAPPLTGLSQEGTDTLTESTDKPAAGPKNGF